MDGAGPSWFSVGLVGLLDLCFFFFGFFLGRFLKGD